MKTYKQSFLDGYAKLIRETGYYIDMETVEYDHHKIVLVDMAQEDIFSNKLEDLIKVIIEDFE